MCRMDLAGPTGHPILLVAPITHLSFNRSHPIARDIVADRQRRVGEISAPLADLDLRESRSRVR